MELQLKAGEALAKGADDEHCVAQAKYVAARAKSYGCTVEILDELVREIGDGEDPTLVLGTVTLHVN